MMMIMMNISLHLFTLVVIVIKIEGQSRGHSITALLQLPVIFYSCANYEPTVPGWDAVAMETSSHHIIVSSQLQLNLFCGMHKTKIKLKR